MCIVIMIDDTYEDLFMLCSAQFDINQEILNLDLKLQKLHLTKNKQMVWLQSIQLCKTTTECNSKG